MSDAESDTDEVQWLLGFVEDAEPSMLLRHRFPSKVGGRPAWLDPVHLPAQEQLRCSSTGRPLDFLLQVYATPPALDGNVEAFHRMLYMFISPQGDQLANHGAVRVFRSQLPRQNPYYCSEPPKAEHRAPRPLDEAQQSEAVADRWHVREAEAAVAARSRPTAQPGLRLYPEWEIVVEPENSYDGNEETDATTERLIQEYRAREASEGALTQADLPPDVVSAIEGNLTEESRHFAAFATAVSKAPEQVLRYCFEPAAVPLWPSTAGVPGAADVPECPNCGAPRQFEFQVLPQLLNHLEVEADDPEAPDWGVIAVYTCSASCKPPDGKGYLEEFAWVQPS